MGTQDLGSGGADSGSEDSTGQDFGKAGGARQAGAEGGEPARQGGSPGRFGKGVQRWEAHADSGTPMVKGE